MSDTIESATNEWLNRLEDLAPHIQNAGDRIERTFSLPKSLVRKIAKAGLFRLLLPASLGGFAVHPVVFSHIVERASMLNGSVGWVLSQQNPFSLYGVYMQDDAVRAEIYGGREPFCGISSGPPGGRVLSLERDDIRGGYHLSYQGHFASGINHASRLAAHVPVDGKENTFILPWPDAKIDNVWKRRKPNGLHGTGSNGYDFTGFVHDRYRVTRDTPETRRDDELSYRFSIYQHCGNGSLSFLRGSAQVYLDETIKLVRSGKKRHSSTKLMRDSSKVWEGLAKAQAKIDRSRYYSEGTINTILENLERKRHDASRRGSRVNVELTRADDATYRLAIVDGSKDCFKAIEILWRLVGSDSIFGDSPFCWIRNDAGVGMQQAQASDIHHETVGHWMANPDRSAINPGTFFMGRGDAVNTLKTG